MKKLAYLPIGLFLLTALGCSMHHKNAVSNSTSVQPPKGEKELYAVMSIKDTIKAGEPISLDFTVYNATNSVKKFLKWQTPFEPLLSKYLDIKNDQGEEVQYKGAMARRMMPPPAEAYLSLKPKNSLSVKIDVLKGYDITKPGKYTITYTSENISGLKVKNEVQFFYK